MSRSVSAPSLVTKTSPCWNGFMVPGSTLRYGSSFCMVTRNPRDFSRLPRLEAVSPLPSEEATPPVTQTCLVDPVEYVAAAKSAPVVGPSQTGGTVVFDDPPRDSSLPTARTRRENRRAERAQSLPPR